MRMYFSIIFLLFTTSTLAGPVLDIEFNGSQLLLGTFEGTKSSSEFYSYGSPNGASANPRYPDTGELIALQADTLQIFSYLETDTNILSLGFILEKYQGSGGGTFQTQATWSDPARVSLLDDPGETGSNITDTSRDFNFTWVNCCTDGFVISGFDPDDMFLDLKNTTGSDLTNVVFLSPDGKSQNISYLFPTDQFNISIAACDPQTDPNQCVVPTIPEPSILALLGLGLAGLGFAHRKTQST